MLHFPLNRAFMSPSDTQNGARGLRRLLLRRLLSIVWPVAWVLIAWQANSILQVIRDFDEPSFEAHCRLHWFRQVAFPWFVSFSLTPSLLLAGVICSRDFMGRFRILATWLLALLCTFLAGVAAYTIWESITMLHCN
jgi:hypothetical protein